MKTGAVFVIVSALLLCAEAAFIRTGQQCTLTCIDLQEAIHKSTGKVSTGPLCKLVQEHLENCRGSTGNSICPKGNGCTKAGVFWLLCKGLLGKPVETVAQKYC
uniref:Uncharacterized protein n=1 Tax=Mucochytrium quahogii TaxID=96639 RepID=A0A7S2W3A6_9STRA|mmetsp:Transcript_625/g.804  ORF Transcript_625/g.804 Transcript_625/m.804 type:complete len:104 (+) Transcript_625:773-1084(+)